MADRNRLDTRYPRLSVEEILQLLGGDVAHELVSAENDRRVARYREWANATVAIEGSDELVPGEWYDVEPGGGKQPGRKWRVCRYVGRERRENYGTVYEAFVFERWGAQAARDPYARGQTERVGFRAVGFRAERIAPDPRVIEKARPKGGAS